jgi:hypothetical protein
MIRRFNYTGRKKISRDRVSIALSGIGGERKFSMSLNLENLKFPDNARVYVDANYKGIYQRFDFGNVTEITTPSDTLLSELPETELVFFDVLVIDESNETGLILGKAGGIPASTQNLPNDRIPLLYVNQTDLKDQIWRLTFEASEDGRPILEINNRIEGLYDLAKNDKRFTSLVYPIAFREVLKAILQEGNYEATEQSWRSDWLTFVDKMLGIKRMPENTEGLELTPEQHEWIDDCVNAYCRKMRVLENFTSEIQ